MSISIEHLSIKSTVLIQSPAALETNKKGSQAPVIGIYLAFPSSHMEQEEYKVDSLSGEPRTGSVQLSS